MSVNIIQKDDGTVQLIDSLATATATAPLVELIEIGRGSTDLDITYIALRNASGTKTYIYGNTGATGVTVSSTKP